MRVVELVAKTLGSPEKMIGKLSSSFCPNSATDTHHSEAARLDPGTVQGPPNTERAVLFPTRITINQSQFRIQFSRKRASHIALPNRSVTPDRKPSLRKTKIFRHSAAGPSRGSTTDTHHPTISWFFGTQPRFAPNPVRGYRPAIQSEQSSNGSAQRRDLGSSSFPMSPTRGFLHGKCAREERAISTVTARRYSRSSSRPPAIRDRT